jgi:4-amino-4-deoxy-L-arabinose transferase-like glycosyltransferase
MSTMAIASEQEISVTTATKQTNRWTSGPAIVLYLAAFKLLIHLLVAGRYSYFVDEMYYIACSDHLDWGYVDHPPLIAFITKAIRLLAGDSLLSLRLLPAVAGAALVVLSGAIARTLGGGALHRR